ncbi:MAG: phage terminase large subunit [Clostridiales bacterium]|nr:phage terminase large subunit [Clostridiales bacterium]
MTIATATQTKPREKKEVLFWLLREKKIRLARESFWHYCQAMAPGYYLDTRPHLKDLCNVLQAFWEDDLLDENGNPYKKLMLNMPPRFGKSRTLILFTTWILGQQNDYKIMTGSYSGDLAYDFSKYTRDAISEEKNLPDQIVFSDIFPGVKIRPGTAAAQKWALEGQHFNYLGTSVGGTATGKGADMGILDDPVKNSLEAYNLNALDKVWNWYSSTFQQRLEEGARQVINMTRWAKADPCGRLLGEYKEAGAEKDVAEPQKWYVHKYEVMDEDGEMLCPDFMSKDTYKDKKAIMDEAIFMANYHQKTIDTKGRMYRRMQFYDIIPLDEDGNPDFDVVVAYCDAADQGSDYLCNIIAGVKYFGGEVYRYVLDIYYTQESAETTEKEVARRYYKAWLDYGFPVQAIIESNAGGRSFQRAVTRILERRFDSRAAKVVWKHQSKNKKARIQSNSSEVVNYVMYPEDLPTENPAYYNAMVTYQRKGGNKFDDAPDATTGLVEITDTRKTKITAGSRV